MKTGRIPTITRLWLAVVLALALVPWVGIAGSEAILDEQLIEAALIGNPSHVSTKLNPRPSPNLAAGVALAMECEPPGGNRPAIDLVDLLLLFMIPASESYNVMPWETGARPGSAIEWKTDGVERHQPVKPDRREGEAIVTIHGKPLCRLRKYIEPAAWSITLIGSKAGVHEIQIAPEAECIVPLEELLRKRSIPFELYKCPPKPFASEEQKIYSVKAPNKKPSWLYVNANCGSAGCWCSFTLFLNQRDADEVLGLSADCPEKATERS